MCVDMMVDHYISLVHFAIFWPPAVSYYTWVYVFDQNVCLSVFKKYILL